MTIIALRLVHILVGIFWVGSLIFVAAFLLPAVRSAGAAGGVVMGRLMQGLQLHRYMVASTWLTILSGVGLAWLVWGQLGLQWFNLGSGRVFGAGAILTILAAVVGLSVNAPTARRLAVLSAAIQGAARAPLPEELAQLQALQARLGRAAIIVAALLVLAAACMAIARYVP